MNESVRIENLLKLLRRGSWTLSGEEVLAFGQVYQYLIDKKEELNKPQIPVVVAEAPPIEKGKSKKK